MGTVDNVIQWSDGTLSEGVPLTALSSLAGSPHIFTDALLDVQADTNNAMHPTSASSSIFNDQLPVMVMDVEMNSEGMEPFNGHA